MNVQRGELEIQEKDLGLKIIESYERWGTWLVSLSGTATAALSVRHGINKGTNADLTWPTFAQFVAVSSLLSVSVFFSLYLVINLKYIGVKWVAGEIIPRVNQKLV